MFESMKPHLAELRQRLAISVLAVFVGFIIAFTFHNAILGWITKPLNNALIQVGKIVEKREMGTWKISGNEHNATLAPSKSPALLSDHAQSAEKLHRTLAEASQATQNPKLQKLLSQAASAAEELARNSRILRKALVKEENLTRQAVNQNLREKSFNGMITTHQVGGAFFVALKVSFFAGILMAMPVILWQLWLFIAPGLYDNEKKMVLPFVVGGSVMFLIGVLFAYYVVTPFGFQFLITFGSFLYTPLINIEDYVGFFTKILIGFGIAFELPVVAYFLALLGLITDKTLKDYFKYAIVIIFLLAAFLTPPDVLTQLLMAAPLILLYGLSILIVHYVNPYKPEEKEDDEEEEEDEFEKAEREFEALEKGSESHES
ncbi:twin-arginine translocase subunit TatC [Nitratifractor salsuginis]|uniref:Sec-independent protein translocase protein TatC n=1 Tax=Nitratifractor salsuginis (strain DSM 16511 / JCM 12458 / E9I37-1) TaxID=749222 RepID=E6X1G9_NITSE|nr:Sec-independent protein translocase, TatC subunit [Nitratifractor salsuginis DSM 16511]